MHLIGDELTVEGMQLAGFKNTHLATKENVSSVLQEVAKVAKIILITQELAKYAKKDIEKLEKVGKMIVEIPDRSGTGEEFVNQLIKEVIGFSIKK
ncbi:MAG: V-type ATP synthase subunit F [Candidatus Altiarchaeota archaeon]